MQRDNQLFFDYY